MKNSGFDARAVANQLLDLGDKRNVKLSNLHLQKVVFFSHGNYLKKFRRNLILNRFEAWEHGPVVPELYHSLKTFGESPVSGRATRFDFEKKLFVEVRDEFDSAVLDFFDEMITRYGNMDPWALVRLSHEPGGPWDRTIRAAQHHANFALVIREDLIVTCFGGSTGPIIQ